MGIRHSASRAARLAVVVSVREAMSVLEPQPEGSMKCSRVPRSRSKEEDVRTNARLVLVVSLFAACGLFAAGCAGGTGSKSSSGPDSPSAPEATGSTAGSKADSTQAPHWVTFRGDTISLKLPDSFSGGNANDPDVQAQMDALEAAGKSAIDVRAQVEFGLELIMMSNPEAAGVRPTVSAEHQDFDVEGSMEGWVHHYAPYQFEAQVKTLTADRADVVAKFNLSSDSDEPTTEERWIFRKVGSQIYVVEYLYDTKSDPEMGPVFRASEKTISITGE